MPVPVVIAAAAALAAKTLAKNAAKANARGLKAANGPSLAKSLTKKPPSALSVKIGKKMYPSGVPIITKGKK